MVAGVVPGGIVMLGGLGDGSLDSGGVVVVVVDGVDWWWWQ